ncbi:hypothetical protein F5Y14DRAFT_362445 [Nemania sp. NC0429]|nr:hypothetical protein F5Y14DRAFT_362445 [Nemania sp. NC0429]
MTSLHQLAYSLESVDDTAHKISFLHLEAAVTKIVIDLGIFKQMSQGDGATSLDSLSKKTGAEKPLFKRIMTHLAATGAVKETGTDEFATTVITRNSATPLAEAGIQHHFATVCPQYQALPAVLKSTGHCNPTNPCHTAFHDAWNTTQEPFAWFGENADYHKYFNDYMALRQGLKQTWLEAYPIHEVLDTTGDYSDRAVFVNTGGGIGHQCAQFKAAYPNTRGRSVSEYVQRDRPKLLDYDIALKLGGKDRIYDELVGVEFKLDIVFMYSTPRGSTTTKTTQRNYPRVSPYYLLET